MTETCRKCGMRDRAVGQRYCAECRKAYDAGRKQKASNGAVESNADVKQTVKRQTVKQCAGCAERDEEIGRLKRLLAERGREVVPVRAMAPRDFAVRAPSGKSVLPHGPNCMGVCCR